MEHSSYNQIKKFIFNNMSRKYIKQQNETNFIYPNNNHTEYDVEIIHNIDNNSVSGTVTNFTATTVNSTGITFSFNYQWNIENAEPWIRDSGNMSLLSVHAMLPNQVYLKPWRLVKEVSATPPLVTQYSGFTTFTILPSDFGVGSLSNGDYYFEFRFIGKRAIYPVCANYTVSTIITPTPTPTPTPTVGPTPTPTPTPTPIPSNFTTGVTLNVTDTGYIKYNKSGVGTVYYNLTSLGTNVLTDCLDCSSIQVGIPFADLDN